MTAHASTRTEALARLAEIEAEVAALRRQLEQPDSQPGEPNHAGPDDAGPDDPGPGDAGPDEHDAPVEQGPPSRRALLGGVAGGAAGLLAGALLGAEPAAAATGAMQYGAANAAGTANTSLSSTNIGSTLEVTNTGSGFGLEAKAQSGVAAEGRAVGGTGIWGYSETGTGVRAVSTTGTALLVTNTTAVGADLRSNFVQLRLAPSSTRLSPTVDASAHQVGDIVRDSNSDLWCCTVAGTPGTWRKLAGPATAGAIHLLAAPVRIYDSRVGTQPDVGTKAPFAAGETRTLDTRANSSGVSATATGAFVTVMVVNAAAGNGNLTVWSAAASKPAANTMVWGGSSGRFSTSALTAVGSTARIKVSPSVACDIVVDVVAYLR